MFSIEEIHSANQDATNGLPSRRPIIEMTIPSVLDKTISPPGILLIYFNARVMLHLAHPFFPLNFLKRLQIRRRRRKKKEYPQKNPNISPKGLCFMQFFSLLLICVTIWRRSKLQNHHCLTLYNSLLLVSGSS